MYTVKQISKLTNISSYTIRFYDNKGLFPFVSRDKNNVRLFSEEDLEWVNFVHCLRSTGMPLTDIKKYISLSMEGKHTAKERYQIMLSQKEKAEQEVIKMQAQVALLNAKIDFYKKLVEEEHGDFLQPTNCKLFSKEK